MAFTVVFPHKESKTYNNTTDRYTIDAAGVLKITYTYRPTDRTKATKSFTVSYSPAAWLEVTESTPTNIPTLTPLGGIHT